MPINWYLNWPCPTHKFWESNFGDRLGHNCSIAISRVVSPEVTQQVQASNLLSVCYWLCRHRSYSSTKTRPWKSTRIFQSAKKTFSALIGHFDADLVLKLKDLAKQCPWIVVICQIVAVQNDVIISIQSLFRNLKILDCKVKDNCSVLSNPWYRDVDYDSRLSIKGLCFLSFIGYLLMVILSEWCLTRAHPGKVISICIICS